MEGSVTPPPGPAPARGESLTHTWQALCKDCRTALGHGVVGKVKGNRAQAPSGSAQFSYSADFATKLLERGQSRTDRCPACRKKHKEVIRAYSVAYIDVTAIGQVADTANPTGPLGGLGPLPVKHDKKPHKVNLQEFQFGLGDSHIVELLDGLSRGKRVAVLEAGTGTGKSTFGPFRLMFPPDRPASEDGRPLYVPTEHGPIVVTEPRIPATTGVATFVGETLCFNHKNCSRHIGPGFPVGYQKQGEKYWDDACQLIYVTDGTMINWIRDGRLARIGMVIVDEAHERSENIDLILALLREQLPRYPHLRVIIASATIDKQFFVEYFGGEDKVHHQAIDAVKGVGYGVPLFPDLEVTDDIIRNGLDDPDPVGHFDPWPTTAPGLDDLRDLTRRLVPMSAHDEIPVEQWADKMPTAVAEQALRLLKGTSADSGDLLAFLPTTDLINQACDQIRRGLRGGNGKTKVYALLSTVSESDKKAALAASKPGERKVVVSSNLAETSLTVSGVRYVIDSGLICQSEWDPHLAEESLPTKPHSQSGVRQRWGRVGRDQPGWVFPLYTRRQFAEMPRNTPPGSTRANLEQFLIKLKAAGVDRPSDVVMPANFTNDGYEPDDEGRKVANTFSLELERAERALAANGAVDGHGHLTVLGRELERFGGPPEHAMAIMFADRLACVHEVGIALTILSSGRLIGVDGLLRFDRDWPPSWRVQATTCHRGLAVGAVDDLELVLRTYAAWERSTDPDAWARRWWVNGAMLGLARAAALELVGSLSSAMKEEAARPIELALIPRARAVLSRALASITYSPADTPDLWTHELKPDAPAVEFGRQQLTRPSGRLVALSRFRPPKKAGAPAPTPVIEGLVNVYDWAREGDPDPFDLAVRAASELRDRPPESSRDALDQLRAGFPVGCVVAVLEATSATSIQRLVRVHDAPDPGDDLPDLDQAGDDDDAEDGDPGPASRRRGAFSGDEEAAAFTVGGRRRDAEVPDDEVAATLGDVRGQEVNDAPGRAEDRAELPDDSDLSEDDDQGRPVEAAVSWLEPPAAANVAALVVGYGMHGNDPTLRLLPRPSDAPLSLNPPASELGAEARVSAGARMEDHTTAFRALHVWGQAGYFLESEMAGSLDPRNRGWVLELGDGTEWPVVVVPGFGAKDPIAVTLLPHLHTQLTKLGGGGRPLSERWLAGTIVAINDVPARARKDGPADDNEAESSSQTERQGVVQLQMPPGVDPAPFRMTIEESKLRRMASSEVGARVEIRLGYRRAKLPTTRDVEDLVNQTDAELEPADGAAGLVTTGQRPLSLKTLARLRKMDPKRSSWQRAVWRCWRESYRVYVSAVRQEGVQDKKQELIEEARRWAASTDWAEAARRLDEMMEEWKAAGSAGRAEDDELWAAFNDLRSVFYDRRRAHFAELDRQRERAAEVKEQLCAQAESLSWSSDWRGTSDRIRELDAAWRAAGSAGRDHEDALWARYRAALDVFYDRRRQHQAELDLQRDSARRLKEQLCIQAEALATSTDWKGTGEAIKQLQAAWKQAGSAGRDIEDTLWARFRGAVDRFFQARQRAFEQQDRERDANRSAKEYLVSQAEQLLYYDRRLARDTYRNLQQQWKLIGPTRREDNERLWQRFRAVGDHLFAR